MLLIPCPFCGPRAEVEFRYAGEAHMTRPQPNCDDDTWAAYLFVRDNVRGAGHIERWRHLHGCGMFFNVERDTVTDQVGRAYPSGEGRAAAGGEI